ncbi:MAG: hypothetical protein IJS78_07125 [Clostridia bacterium]|nr:hypothetical protein [Clostridia bacterium]
MSILDLIDDRDAWEDFFDYKSSLSRPGAFVKRLRLFIDGGEYRPVAERVRRGDPFPLPVKSVISKQGAEKKRVVYTYPEPENTVLKMLTHQILRKYDGLFCRSLYSFRPGRTAKDAVRKLLRVPGIFSMYSYKADIHDYFNSIPVDRLLPLLREAISDDGGLFSFLSSLLTEERMIDRGRETTEKKGIMAGTPQSSFYANLFLSGMDRRFEGEGVVYSRYSDDVILFSPTEEEVKDRAGFIRDYLAERSLSINEKKEEYRSPGEPFTYLGFICSEEKVDIAPATLRKLKMKMRRKRDALMRWEKRTGSDGERAAMAFLRVFNRKMFESGRENELSWSRWFFPVINTTESLEEIDRYAQDCVRYLVSGTHTKARFSVRYGDIKALGYRNLVNEYYKTKDAPD